VRVRSKKRGTIRSIEMKVHTWPAERGGDSGRGAGRCRRPVGGEEAAGDERGGGPPCHDSAGGIYCRPRDRTFRWLLLPIRRRRRSVMEADILCTCRRPQQLQLRWWE
jgi:hypothetical protein